MKSEHIALNLEELNALLDRIEKQKLEVSDYPLIADLLRSMAWLSQELDENNLTIRRLKKLFGIGSKTEKTSDLPKNSDNSNSDSNPIENSNSGSLNEKGNSNDNQEKKKNRKKWSIEDYKNAIITKISHQFLKVGMRCPECKKGNLRLVNPGKFLRIIGQPWLQAHIYEQEKFRCNTCGKTFTANLPTDISRAPKYDKTAKAIVCLLKYRGGFPFYRQESLQTMLETPVSDSVLWEMTRDVAVDLEPIYEVLIQEAAKGDCLHNDDTKARVLDLIKENKTLKKEDEKKRVGIFTTAILSKLPDKEIALFFTGRQHAGENLNDVLDNRPSDMSTPTQMCDASSNNKPKNHETDESNCLAHLRRKFYEIADIWPSYILPIIIFLNIVFRNERILEKNELDDEERLKFHQKQSKAAMTDMKNYCQSLLDEKKTEPNSKLGKAINYMNNHWEAFTLFLKKPGVPLDNNSDERLIKRCVLNRKNGLFFKTENGARIGDILLSFIETCNLNNINPYNYLVAIQEHSNDALLNPSDWMPWNYLETISDLGYPPSIDKSALFSCSR